MCNSLTHLTDSELRTVLPKLVATERAHFITLIDHLAEVEVRGLHQKWGYASLWDYAARELKLKDGVAFTRITLARLIRRRPEIRTPLSEGRLGQSQAVALNEFAASEDFADLLVKAEGMSKREFVDFLAMRRGAAVAKRDVIRRVAPEEPAKVAPPPAPVKEGVVLTPTPRPQPVAPVVVPEVKTHRISFLATEGLVEKLHRAQDLAGTSELETVLNAALEAYLDRKDPVRREERRVAREERVAKKEEDNTGDKVMNRHIPARTRDAVMVRDEGQCTYVGRDGVRCGAKRHLEIDHVVPFSIFGSSHDENNLRVLCRSHNLMRARETFGDKVPRREGGKLRHDGGRTGGAMWRKPPSVEKFWGRNI